MAGSHRRSLTTLSSIGLLPTGYSPSSLPFDESSYDLLPMLVRAWQSASAGGSRADRRRARRHLDRFKTWQSNGARLTLGIPNAFPAAQEWIETRLAWWPQGIPSGKRVGLVSSRLGRALDTQKEWFTVLRAVCAKLDPEGDLLLTAASTTTAPYADRCAALFGLRALRIDVSKDKRASIERWISRLGAAARGDSRVTPVFLSPPLTSNRESLEEQVRSAPIQDRALVALSDRLLAFRVRRNGNIDRLIRARIRHPGWPLASVYVALGPKLVRTEMAGELMDSGAVGWVVLEAPDKTELSSQKVTQLSESPRASSPLRAAKKNKQPAAVVPLPSSEDWPYLTHWTRRCEGPWPGQDETHYLDDLILSRSAADHSALATIKRLINQQRIIATSQTIRGAIAVVSFTAVPLAELHRLRVFRPHRGRWDFEPYGICLRRDWLEQHGAQPVQYGDDQLWQRLSADQRPFFQLRGTQPSRGNAIDWTVEDEWRVVGDVDLSQLPAEAALVFAPTLAEARQIAAVSRWPVTVTSYL
jgi:hypothetical protein